MRAWLSRLVYSSCWLYLQFWLYLQCLFKYQKLKTTIDLRKMKSSLLQQRITRYHVVPMVSFHEFTPGIYLVPKGNHQRRLERDDFLYWERRLKLLYSFLIHDIFSGEFSILPSHLLRGRHGRWCIIQRLVQYLVTTLCLCTELWSFSSSLM